MILRVDLRHDPPVSRSRMRRVLNELAMLDQAWPDMELEIVADGESAFAARLAMPATARLVDPHHAACPAAEIRPFAEACQASLGDWPTLAEALDLGLHLDQTEGPAEVDARLAESRHLLTCNSMVHWRIASEWQRVALADQIDDAEARIHLMPASVLDPMTELLGFEAQLPMGMPATYSVCLTDIGTDGLECTILEGFAMSRDCPPLVFLGNADSAGLPAMRETVSNRGLKGRVAVVQDLDPVTELTVINQASVVIVADRHATHAIRPRQAAALGKRGAVLDNKGNRAWIDGGAWFSRQPESIARALDEALPMRLRHGRKTARYSDSLADWIARALGDQ